MKTTDLIIGDWVFFVTPVIVTEIGEDWIVRDDAIQRTPIDMINPIPLTAEILEKNEFKKDAKRLWSLYDGISIDASFTLGEVVKDGQLIVFRCSPFKVKYVHELQHALRLCGLTELADNFRIN